MREPGFYWVDYLGCMWVAEYCDMVEAFYLPGILGSFSEDSFNRVDSQPIKASIE